MNDVIFGSNGVNVETLVNGDYIVIGCAVSCAFEFENELIGKTDVNAGLFRKKRVRISDTRGSVQGLTTLQNSATRLTIFHFLQEAIRRTEQTMRFVFTDQAGFIRYINGIFLVKAVNISGDQTAFSEYDLQLEGTGNVDIGEVLPPGSGDGDSGDDMCVDLFSDTWIMAEDETSVTGLGQQGKSFLDSQIIEVDREGTQYDYTTGSPGNRQFAYDGTEVSFEQPANPGGEAVFVVWKANES